MATILIVVVLGITAAFSRSTYGRINDVTERDIRWLQGVGTTDREVFLLIERYLVRVRSHRWAGGVAGVIGAMAIGLGGDEGMTVIISAESPWSDLVFGCLFGLLVASLLADTYRVVPALLRHGSVVGLSSPRIATSYMAPLSLLLVALTVVVAVDRRTGATVALALVGLIAAGVYAAFLWVIGSGRRKPDALDLRHADDAIRRYGFRRFSSEGLAMAVLLFGWQVGTVLLTGNSWAGVVLLVVAAVSAALVVRSRPYPPIELET